MRAHANDETGEFEITVPVKFTFDPSFIGYDQSDWDLRQQVKLALSRIPQEDGIAVLADEA